MQNKRIRAYAHKLEFIAVAIVVPIFTCLFCQVILTSESQGATPSFVGIVCIISVGASIVEILILVELFSSDPIMEITSTHLILRAQGLPWLKLSIAKKDILSADTNYMRGQTESDTSIYLTLTGQTSKLRHTWPVMGRVDHNQYVFQGLMYSTVLPDDAVEAINRWLEK